jgi:Tol biopolymer transport system component
LVGHNTIYVADLNANGIGITKPKHFTLTDSVDLPVGWTPDSKAVIIRSNRTGHFGIYKQALNEDTATLIVPPTAGLGNARISSDGDWILYTRREELGTLSRSSEDDVLRIPVTGGSPDLLVKVRGGSLLCCARSPSNLCIVAEPTVDHKQVIISALDPLKGIGPELVRFNPDSIANTWAIDLSPDGTRIAAIPSSKGPIQILSLRGQPQQEIQMKDWNRVHTLNWAADGNGILVSNSMQGGAAILHVDLRGNAQVMWKNPGVNWTPALESPDGRHLAFQSALMEGNVWMMDDF